MCKRYKNFASYFKATKWANGKVATSLSGSKSLFYSSLVFFNVILNVVERFKRNENAKNVGDISFHLMKLQNTFQNEFTENPFVNKFIGSKKTTLKKNVNEQIR